MSVSSVVFAGARWPGHDNDLTALDLQAVVVQDLVAAFSLAKVMVEIVDADDTLVVRDAGQQRGRGGAAVGHAIAAGSWSRSRLGRVVIAWCIHRSPVS